MRLSIAMNYDSKLVEEHLWLVKKIALHLKARLPRHILLDDLIQSGTLGLIEAAQKFQTDKGAAFTTYASIRVRGSILDELRRLDWAPRTLQKNIKRVSLAIKKIENEQGRDAKDYEVAEYLGFPLNEYYQLLQDMNIKKICSLEDMGVNDDQIAELSEEEKKEPASLLEKEDQMNVLMAEIEKLSEKEKLVLSLYYDEELNLKEIGEALGVSESRVCQIHGQATVRLRSRLNKWH
jgi:RNA polymerase sigma factor for flagellar operon FliA